MTDLINLLQRVALDDQIAFAKLYQQCAPKLNGIARLMVRDAEKANEVLHDAFMQIWKNADEYQEHKSEPMTWMSSIVKFRALDLLRKQGRRLEGRFNRLSDEEYLELENTLHWQKENTNTATLSLGMQTCLSQLSGDQKDAVIFAYLYGYSREDIAHIFTTSVNTVKSWLHRGVRNLQQCLTQ
ncbi:RNA polymerase sigma factor [Alteromonas oceanisediminis]|uniref:RNA polymerase sigma factor n=1 Tax=Alteromonas oceanisediminis TaxID=2836180 RepID=UPI001BDABE1D|nr:RNA polymerase sigma factor [Alteromonas oceanisediminis]MBT0586995.1 RNA polymerase sigma factor [Alteromonas oceanisediminis]